MDINEIKRMIAALPAGGITVKKITNKKTGRVYEYNVYQWSENGKQRSRYLKYEELLSMNAQIQKRRQLEQQLRDAEVHSSHMYNIDEYIGDGKSGENIQFSGKYETPKDYMNDSSRTYPDYRWYGMLREGSYYTDVHTGEELRSIISGMQCPRKRELYKQLESYIYGDGYNRVLILYGLRRTGKTTMIRQAISEMKEDDFARCALIQIKRGDTMNGLNQDLRRLLKCNYKYIFIDEVTLLDDFIDGAALLSDIYAGSGMKVVLSGTDSLGFWLAKSNELYDRCIILHTTFIPYREFERVLGTKGIDTYIQYGGTMCMSGKEYNPVWDGNAVDEYVDSSIAHNIQHSLKYYQDGNHFRYLYMLYEANELTSAINRIVEDMNHRFTVDVLIREFKSGDLSLSIKNLSKTTDIMNLIDKIQVTERLKDYLEIKNKPEQKVEIDEGHVAEIQEYLIALDLIKEIRIDDITKRKLRKRTVFTQAGLRYAQAKLLIEALMQDDIFGELPQERLDYVIRRILNEIKGRMMEDVVLLETAMRYPRKGVFKLEFSDGEYDMVVTDRETLSCQIYEIKHTDEIDKSQYRHLIDEDKLERTAFRYGRITGRYVIYRGAPCTIEGIEYLNVEEYLLSLGPDKG